MKLGIVLHLYQPYAQTESVFRRVTTDCYIPLINYIKSTKLNLTLNIPLSTLEQFEQYGYADLLRDLKNLYNEEIIELTGTGAYHPLLTRIPLDHAENQILLQEYGLGYFFGSQLTHDDQKSSQLKNLIGFFPPELAFSSSLLPVIESMGYSWVLIEDIALETVPTKSNNLFKLPNSSLTLVSRNSFISNLISFKRDTDVTDVTNHTLDELHASVSHSLVISFDAECLGHHYTGGLIAFDALLRSLSQKDVSFTRVCDLTSVYPPATITSIKECSWGASRENMLDKNPYPFWYIPNNVIHDMLAGLDNALLSNLNSVLLSTKGNNVDSTNSSHDSQCLAANSITSHPSSATLSPTLPNWCGIYDMSSGSTSNHTLLTFYLTVQQFLHSDKYWWSSKLTVYPNTYLWNPTYVKSSLDVLVTNLCSVKDFLPPNDINQRISKLKDLLT